MGAVPDGIRAQPSRPAGVLGPAPHSREPSISPHQNHPESVPPIGAYFGLIYQADRKVGPMSIKWTPEMETLSRSRLICCLRLGWSLVIEGAMDALPLIKHLDSGTDRHCRFGPSSTCRPVQECLFPAAMPGFHHGIIRAISLPTPAGRRPVGLQALWVSRRGRWAPPIRVRPYPGRRPAVDHRAGSGAEHSVGRPAPIHGPSPQVSGGPSPRGWLKHAILDLCQ
jgi:hypothetical protein